MKVIYTVNKSQTALRMSTCKDETQETIIKFILSGKNYGNWNFMDIVEKKDRGWTGGENPYFIVITNRKIFVDQIYSNESLEEFAARNIQKLQANEIFVFNLKDDRPWNFPKFNIESYSECGDAATWVYVTSER